MKIMMEKEVKTRRNTKIYYKTGFQTYKINYNGNNNCT